MKTLFIHCGYPKCGSSSIQKYLLSIRQDLAQLGMGVIGYQQQQNVWPPQQFGTSYPHVNLSDTFRKDASKIQLWEAIKREFQSFEKLIVSAETLAFSPAALVELVELATSLGAKSVISFYVRRPSSWQISCFKQWGFRKNSVTKLLTASPLKDEIQSLSVNMFAPWMWLQRFNSQRSWALTRLPNWNAATEHIEQSIAGHNYQLIVRPLDKRYLLGHSLLNDFAKHTLNIDRDTQSDQQENVSFPEFLIFGTIHSTYQLPSHKNNELALISSLRVPSRMQRPSTPYMDEVQQLLNDIIDGLFMTELEGFCERFELPVEIFSPIEKRDPSDFAKLPDLINTSNYKTDYIKYLQWLNQYSTEVAIVQAQALTSEAQRK